MSWFTKPLDVTEAAPRLTPSELPAQERERLQREWRAAELEFDNACAVLENHDAKRPHLDTLRARAAERRNRLLAELAALPKEASRG